MSWALNLGSSSMPGGLSANHVPHGGDADEPREECLGCGERECICGEDYCDCGDDTCVCLKGQEVLIE